MGDIISLSAYRQKNGRRHSTVYQEKDAILIEEAPYCVEYATKLMLSRLQTNGTNYKLVGVSNKYSNTNNVVKIFQDLDAAIIQNDTQRIHWLATQIKRFNVNSVLEDDIDYDLVKIHLFMKVADKYGANRNAKMELRQEIQNLIACREKLHEYTFLINK